MVARDGGGNRPEEEEEGSEDERGQQRITTGSHSGRTISAVPLSTAGRVAVDRRGRRCRHCPCGGVGWPKQCLVVSGGVGVGLLVLSLLCFLFLTLQGSPSLSSSPFFFLLSLPSLPSLFSPLSPHSRVCHAFAVPLSQCSPITVQLLMDIAATQLHHFHTQPDQLTSERHILTPQLHHGKGSHRAGPTPHPSPLTSVTSSPSTWVDGMDLHLLPEGSTIPSVSCAKTGALWIRPEATGFGSQLMFYVGALIQSHSLGRVLHIDPSMGYARGCPFNRWGLDCFFVAPSPCTYDRLQVEKIRETAPQPTEVGGLVMPSRAEHLPGLKEDSIPPLLSFEEMRALPQWSPEAVNTSRHSNGSSPPFLFHFHQYRDTQYWTQLSVDREERYDPRYKDLLPMPLWRLHFLLYLFRPQPWLRAYWQRQKEEALWPINVRDLEGPLGLSASTHPLLYSLPDLDSMRAEHMVIGMHIRQGDKVWERDGDLPTLSQYHDVALSYQQRWGFRHLFLASDSSLVLDQAKREWTSFTIHTRSDAQPVGNTTLTVGSKVFNEEDATPFALDALTNLYLLSICQTFIGFLHTNFGMLAAELQAVKNFTRAPMHFLRSESETSANANLRLFTHWPVDRRLQQRTG